MTDRDRYFAQAGSWADDARARTARASRIAWTVAGAAVAVAVFEALALAMLAPLKTVQPVTLLVDRQTGYVQALDPLQPRRVGADAALTQSFLAQYVGAREAFDRATIAVDYRKVALWSAGPARTTYLARMPATSPTSPFQVYPAGTVVTVRVKSVSRLDPGTALVRFDTQRQDRTGRVDAAQPWISVVRYRYSDAAMRLEDRLVNPLGFQVTSYRRDAEAPPPVTQAAAPDPVAAEPVGRTVPPVRAAQPGARSVDRSGVRTSYPRVIATAPAGERREVPIANVPLGSPLSPGPGR